jgi:hypothetical protein
MTNPSRIKKSSGVSTHRTGAPQPTAPTEEDLEKMPLHKLRELANKQLAERQ